MAELYDPTPTFMDFGRDLLADYRLIVADPWKLCESDLIKIACPALRRALAAEAELARCKDRLARWLAVAGAELETVEADYRRWKAGRAGG